MRCLHACAQRQNSAKSAADNQLAECFAEHGAAGDQTAESDPTILAWLQRLIIRREDQMVTIQHFAMSRYIGCTEPNIDTLTVAAQKHPSQQKKLRCACIHFSNVLAEKNDLAKKT
jgi:hypothetical protein